MRSSRFTLIEVLISLSLIAILLTCLLGWYGHLTRKKADLQKSKRPVVREYYAYERIETALGHARPPCFFSKTEVNGSMSLIFTFDHGLHPNAQLADGVLGKLYIENGALLLSIWPGPLKGEAASSLHETIVLLEGVEQMECKFLAPKPIDFLKVQPKEIGGYLPEPGWHSSWGQQGDTLPALVRIILRKKPSDEKASYDWLFDLKQPIIYPVEDL